MSTYTPQAGSLAAEVIGTFKANPEIEEMSISDIIRLWPHKAKTSNLNPCLATPLEHRILTRARNAKGDLVYRRGLHFSGKPAPVAQPPQPPATPPQAAPAAAPAAPQPPAATTPPRPPAAAPVVPTASRKASRGRWVRLPEIDVAALPVRKDLPIPMTQQAIKGHTRYDEIFQGLQEPGDSRAPIDIAYYQTLAKAAKVYGKARGVTLLVRRIDDSSCGVWRK